MSYEVMPFTDRADWLAQRRKGIGASDIAGIMGVSPYTTPFQVWASKIQALPDTMDDEVMYWGRVLEDVILNRWAEQVLNGPYAMRGVLLRSKQYPWMMATPDAVTDFAEGDIPAGVPVDAKNDGSWRWDEIPPHYRLQLHHQMVVLGAEVGFLAVLHNGKHLETYRVENDEEMRNQVVNAAEDFWKLVEANEAPPVEADDYTVMQSLWPRTVESPIEIPWDLAAELYDAKDDRDAGKKRYEKAAAAVKEIMRDDADTAIVDQQVVATWKGEPRRFVVKGEGLE